MAGRVPHVQVVGNVARVARLKVHRELERGELEAAIRDLARLLRLSRDLLPRGVMIVDMVSASADRSAVEHVIVPMLTAQGLTVVHCDRMLALLREHETRSIDAYSEGLRAEYVSSRATLHGLIYDQEQLRKEWERFGNPVGPSIVAEVTEPILTSALARRRPYPPAAGSAAQRTFGQTHPSGTSRISMRRIAQTTPDELAAQVRKLNELYRGLLGVAGDCPERVRKSTERPPSLDANDIHTRITRGLASSAFTEFTQSLASSKARLRIAMGLIAVRRWQLAHGRSCHPRSKPL